LRQAAFPGSAIVNAAVLAVPKVNRGRSGIDVSPASPIDRMDDCRRRSYLIAVNTPPPPPAPGLTLRAELAVIGAGPVGTTLAILAAKRGIETVLIDARPIAASAVRDSRTFAIVRGSWRLLGAAGLHSLLAGQTEPLNGLEAMDGGQHIFGAPTASFGVKDLAPGKGDAPLGQMVPAEILQAALDQIAAITPGLTWRRGVRFEGLATDPGGADIALGTGERLRAQLIAACDGAASPVRNALGIKVEKRSYGKSVFAANVKLSRPHGGIARQLFTPEGPFATLPLRDNHANLAWYLKTGAAETLAALPLPDINAELNARFAGFAGPMEIVSAPLTYPLTLQVAAAMTGPRTALLGDAAHRINPLAGQGLNLGFKDVGALIDCMEDARQLGLGPGSASALLAYRQARRFDGAATALFMDMVDRAFSNANPVLTPLRGLALLAADRAAPIRKALARQASADQDNLPRLMRG
jgi:2-octaprenyl-6-methoxyphenol hydroxylase